MTKFTLPDDLESTMAMAAERAGTTTELLAIETLRRMFLGEPTASATEGSLLAYLGDYVGSVKGLDPTLSQDTGRKFGDIVAEKPERRQQP